MRKIYWLAGMAVLSVGQLYAQSKKQVAAAPPGLTAIREADIKKDIFELAGDAFRGRRAGTLDEMRAAAWTAQKAQQIGLKPVGDDDTYFQFYNIRRSRIASRSTVTLNGQPLTLWKQVWITQPTDAHFDAPVIWLNSAADTVKDLTGKVAAIKVTAPNPLPAAGMSLWGYRYTIFALRQATATLRRKGAAAIMVVADDEVEKALPFAGHNYEEGTYQNEGSAAAQAAARQQLAPVMLVRTAIGAQLQQAGARVKADIQSETFMYPSANIVAKAEGTDAELKKQYVLFSGHHDHDGVGTAIDQDSIWNGADDNASVEVAMLAAARAWVKHPGKRSALFIWHGGEERGLLGSRWYAAHPTVDKKSIIAVLNGDMMGRNAPDSAALLGTTSHKNSTQLVDMALKANQDLTHFKLDFSWDDAKHPEGWYFRSDHLPYAQAGIPSIFFTTLLHPDYHTPRDEPQRIDITKLTKMAKWMYATGWLVSQTPQVPALDANATVTR